MKKYLKKIAMLTAISAFTMTQAHAFCAYNKNTTGKKQIWYFMKD